MMDEHNISIGSVITSVANFGCFGVEWGQILVTAPLDSNGVFTGRPIDETGEVGQEEQFYLPAVQAAVQRARRMQAEPGLSDFDRL